MFDIFKDVQSQTFVQAEEKGLLEIEKKLQKYSGEEPHAMKYVEALCERSSYLADVDSEHLKILEALKPLKDGVAELSQIAADLGMTTTTMKSGSDAKDPEYPKDPGLDLSTLRPTAAFILLTNEIH